MKLSKLPLVAAAVLVMGATTAKAEIIIATAGPMTGQYAAFGEQMKRGAEMAVADINASGDWSVRGRLATVFPAAAVLGLAIVTAHGQ